MATIKASTKRVTLTRTRAKSAAKKARKHFESHPAKTPTAWKKGGKEWSRVLGHFGPSK